MDAIFLSSSEYSFTSSSEKGLDCSRPIDSNCCLRSSRVAIPYRELSDPWPMNEPCLRPCCSSASRAGMLINGRSEEHTSELQSLIRISYAVLCLKKKTNYQRKYIPISYNIDTAIEHRPY